MPNLTVEIDKYLTNEEKINKAKDAGDSLKQKHENIIKAHESFNIEEAEKAYEAWSKIEAHANEIEKARGQMAEAEAVIKKYLYATKKKKIYCMWSSSGDKQTYSFSLDDYGKLKHNHQR